MRLLKQALWFVALLGLLLSSLSVSWLLNAQANYGYSFWYEVLSIDEHIDTYAPENIYKTGFETLSKNERVQAFNAISKAVHNHGQGLASITYNYHNYPQQLLTKAEVIHLQDVANLIDILLPTSAVVALVTIILLLYLWQQKVAVNLKAQAMLLLGVVAFVTLVVLVLGAKDVFYQMHVWIFPDNHQWFFYYQESLMSTLMKAPDLFAGIAVAILAGALLLLGSVLALINYFVGTPDS